MKLSPKYPHVVGLPPVFFASKGRKPETQFFSGFATFKSSELFSILGVLIILSKLKVPRNECT